MSASGQVLAPPVCKECGQCARNETWRGFAMPPGVDMLTEVSCTPSSELGRDHAVLPATHTQAGAAAGLWLYYARGCSDYGHPMGRTLLARNRVHGALLLEDRLRTALGETDAAPDSLAALVARLGRHKRLQHWLHAMQARVAPLLRARHLNVTLQATLAEAADGVYDATRCNPAPTAPLATRCRGKCLERIRRLSHFVGNFALDVIMWEQLAALRAIGPHAALDTMQFHMQPQGNGAIRWATELWDVRTAGAGSPSAPRGQRTKAKAKAHRDRAVRMGLASASLNGSRAIGAAPAAAVAGVEPPPGSLLWANGSACAPSSESKVCLACAGSRLEHRCQVRDWQAYCNSSYGAWRMKIGHGGQCGRPPGGGAAVHHFHPEVAVQLERRAQRIAAAAAKLKP